VSVTSKTWRRRFGGVCLALAIGMLLAGETVLKTKLTGGWLLCYWLGCFVLTALAAGAALIDAARVSQESRAERRALIENTLQEIEREKNSRPKSKD